MQRVHLWGPVACSVISPLFPTWMRLSGDQGPRAAIHCSWHYQPKLIVHYLLLSKLCPLPLSLPPTLSQFQPSPHAYRPHSQALLTESKFQSGLFSAPDTLWIYFFKILLLSFPTVFRLIRWWICQGILRNFTWWHCFPFCSAEATGHVLCMLGTLAVAQMCVPFLLFLSLGIGKQTETAIK